MFYGILGIMIKINVRKLYFCREMRSSPERRASTPTPGKQDGESRCSKERFSSNQGKFKLLQGS